MRWGISGPAVECLGSAASFAAPDAVLRCEPQGMSMDPSMMNMMKDLDGAEMNKQLETLGLSPSEVINKIMAEPDLAAAFQKPKVMQVRWKMDHQRGLPLCLGGDL